MCVCVCSCTSHQCLYKISQNMRRQQQLLISNLVVGGAKNPILYTKLTNVTWYFSNDCTHTLYDCIHTLPHARTHARTHAHTHAHTHVHTRAHTHTHLLNSLRRIQVHQKNLQCIRTHNRKDSWSVKVIPTYLPMYVRNLYVSTCNTLHTYICTTCYCSTHTHSTHNNHMHTYTAPSYNPHTANKSNEIVSGHTVVDTPHTYSHSTESNFQS